MNQNYWESQLQKDFKEEAERSKKESDQQRKEEYEKYERDLAYGDRRGFGWES